MERLWYYHISKSFGVVQNIEEVHIVYELIIIIAE